MTASRQFRLPPPPADLRAISQIALAGLGVFQASLSDAHTLLYRSRPSPLYGRGMPR